jgi:hypothetical protein
MVDEVLVFSGPSQRAAFSEDSVDPGLRDHVTNEVTLYQSKKNIILARASVGVQVPEYLRVLGNSSRGFRRPCTRDRERSRRSSPFGMFLYSMFYYYYLKPKS